MIGVLSAGVIVANQDACWAAVEVDKIEPFASTYTDLNGPIALFFVPLGWTKSPPYIVAKRTAAG